MNSLALDREYILSKLRILKLELCDRYTSQQNWHI